MQRDDYYREEVDQNQFEEEQVYVNEDDMPKVLIESVHKRVSHGDNNEINERNFIQGGIDDYLGFCND